MGAVVVVPGRVATQFIAHLVESQRNENLPRALCLHGPNEPLDDRDARVLADCAEPGS